MNKVDKESALRKMEKMTRALEKLDSLVVAFSGGVDSAFLLYAAQQALGDSVVGVTARSPLHPAIEGKEAARFAEKQGIAHMFFSSREMNNPEFVSNKRDRCYHCKKMLFEDIFEIAQRKGVENVAHGANIDDMDEFRPGLRAARETGAIAPLVDAGLGKEEIRYLSKERGLPTWGKAANSCLAARIPYGSPITADKLERIGRAETWILEQGFEQVRVRYHGPVARLEVGEEELDRLLDVRLRKAAVEALRKLGFQHVCVDLEGYISGKLDRE